MQDIVDMHAADDFISLASSNHHDFLSMKQGLVSRRRDSGLTLEQMAHFLGETQEYVARFEDYDYDPKASEIQQYAIAVMMQLKVEAIDFHPAVEYVTKGSGSFSSGHTSEIDTDSSNAGDSRMWSSETV